MPRDPLAFLQRQQQRQPRRDPIAFLRRQAPPLTPMRAPEVPPGTLEDLQIGAARGYLGLTAPIEAAGDIVAGALTGDFRPLKETGKRLALGAASYIAPPGSAPAFNAAIEEARAQTEARQFNQGNLPAIRRAVQEAQLAKLEAKDPSLAGRLTRGAVSTAIQSAPYIAAAPAGIPALAATGAAMSLGEPENIPLSTGLAVTPLPIGQAFRAGVNAVRRALGKGAAQIVEAEAMPAATARVRESIGEPPPIVGETIPAPAQPAASIQTVFGKLETDNVEQIGAMIANANRRFRKSSTPAERQSSWDDYRRLNQLTPDEQRALGQVLPARTVSPVGEFAEGGYSREVRDIPMSEPNPQLDANLRELEQFFGSQRGAPALEAEFGVSAAAPSARAASASVTGPSASASLGLDVAASGGGGRRPPSVSVDAPWEPEWAREPLQSGLFPRAASLDAPWGPQWTGQPLQDALIEGARAVPAPLMRRIKDEFFGALGALKSLKSTGDISAPFRQGALLMLRPMQWRQAGKAWGQMFRAFRTKDFEAINRGIDFHPNAKAMDDAGLYLANRAKEGLAKGEEAFLRRSGSKISEVVSKTRGIKHSEQAYTTFLDTQRVEAFAQYKRIIDKAGLSTAEALKAEKAAAQWINIATGRGSLGKRLDKAMEGLNFFFFSPRYVASRLNVFNPAMYIRNASSPGGRVVLKQQMADLMQFASVVATTMYLAKQAGADVGLNPNSPDFLKIRFGNWRYDTLAGLQQVMRLVYRVGADIGRAAQGEKPKPGQTAIDIGETFLNYKLSPPAGVFRDFINQRTVDRKPFTAGRAIADLTAPMQWADFVEAYQKEAWGGVAKTSFGATGIGVQNYEQSPVDAAIERSQPLFSELQRLNKRVSELRRKDGEKDDAFNARVQQFSANYTLYGQRLLNSPRFQQAPDALKAVALDRLNERAKQITHREFAFPEIELDPNIIMDAAEQSKKNPAGNR